MAFSGTVKWFDDEKGFGFIKRDDTGEDVFVHITSILESGMESFEKGQRVKFYVTEGREGSEAVMISSIDDGDSQP